MKERTIDLNGTWDLWYRQETADMPEDPEDFRKTAEHISAQVPGNIELDLERAGKEPDPFYGQNIYRFRKYEFYRWQFERTFEVPGQDGHRWMLCLEGVNTFADCFLNGVLIGSCDNCFIEHNFDVTDALRYGRTNTLAVRIRSAVNEARKTELPAYASTHECGDYIGLRMPASSFGWDIMGRFLSAGLWRGVSLKEVPDTAVTDLYWATKSLNEDGSATVRMRYWWKTDAPTLDGFTLRVRGVCGDSVFATEKTVAFTDGVLDIRVPDARLWWPKAYGPQDLYTVTTELRKDGVTVAERRDVIGIRRIGIVHRMEIGDDGEFLVTVNGTKIMCKGSNWVPLDALHSRDAGRLDRVMALVNDAGCNILRCWGGNVYEDHAFFDACDRSGILVWQDFAMACAAYPATAEFRDAIEREATAVVRKLRNHPCLLLWAGDNEVDETTLQMGFASEDNRWNELTRVVLPRVVRMHDPYRYYLPSSPYIPKDFPRYGGPEQHNWGARAYFKDDFYKHTGAHFISECGYHGCPAPESLRKFLPEGELDRWAASDDWDTHNTDYLPRGRRSYNRNLLMQDQVEILFGTVPRDLETFAKLSQISQAEAKKFFIERSKIKKWRRTGIIWWNLIDGWPQISDAVVDYYFHRKLAYFYIRRVQQPVVLMMDELTDWTHDVILGNDGGTACRVRYRVTDGETGEILLRGECLSGANENRKVGSIRELAGRQRLYLLETEIDGKTYGNHYISGTPVYDPEKMLRWVDLISKLPEPFEWKI